MKLITFIYLISCNLLLKQVAENKNYTSLPWSEKMAMTIINDYPELWQNEGRTKPAWGYTQGLIALAFQKLYEKTGKNEYFNYIKNYYESVIDSNGRILNYKLSNYSLDDINAGKVLFFLYEKTGDIRYKIAIDTLIKQLKTHPKTQAGGYWHKKRYPNQMWLDGVYMAAPFMMEYSTKFNKPEIKNEVIKWIIAVELKTRDPKTGLLYHAWDESKSEKWANPTTGTSPNFWGRGIGWYAMALVDVMDFLPRNSKEYRQVKQILERLIKAMIKYQDKNTGAWYQVINKMNEKGNYLEGSVTAMMSYVILKGVNNGYLKKSYKIYGIKAYNSLLNHLSIIKNDWHITITPVCAVAGLGGNPYRDGSYEYYINEKKRDNDPKATGPFILASLEYEKIINNFKK